MYGHGIMIKRQDVHSLCMKVTGASGWVIAVLGAISIVISIIPIKSGIEQHPIYVALVAFVLLMAISSVLLAFDRMPLKQERYHDERRMRFAVYYCACGLICSAVSAAVTRMEMLDSMYAFIILMILIMSFGDYFVKVNR